MVHFDGIHHNRAGEEFVAKNWFEVLSNILPDIEPKPFQINTGHAGAWFNPESPGQGQLIDVESEGELVFFSCFTFTDSVDSYEQHWFTGQGNYSGDSVDLMVYETLGGRFDDPQEVSTVAVGDESTVSGQCWLTAQGPLRGSIADLVIYETLGGSFDNAEPSESNPVGMMNIDFTDCSKALLSYSITDGALAGMINIERAIPGTETLCMELSEQHP